MLKPYESRANAEGAKAKVATSKPKRIDFMTWLLSKLVDIPDQRINAHVPDRLTRFFLINS